MSDPAKTKIEDPEFISGLCGLYAEAEGYFQENNSPLNNLKNIESHYSEKIFLDEGGMKQVFTCRDLRSDRLIAYAMVNDQNDSEKLNDFLREAKITAYLQHPNIIPVYEIGLNEEQNPYFTMKLIEGENLAKVLKKLKQNDPETSVQFPLPRLIDIFEKVCDAIAYAHSKGILHLDIKPENISVNEYGEVLVCDWGISEPCPESLKSDSDSEEFVRLLGFVKNDRKIRGTPSFMAPEQINHSMAEKSPLTDIYALGVLLYSFLTKDVPFRHTSQEDELKAVLKGGFLPPSEKLPDANIPKSLEAICIKAMQYLPAERYMSVSDIISDLQRYKHGYATEAEDASAFELISLLYKRNKQSCLAAMIAIAVIIITVTFSMVNIRKSEQVAITERNKAVAAKNQTLELINNLKEEQLEKLNMASKAAHRYLQNLRNALYFKNFEKADRTIKTVWELGSHDEEIQLYYGWYQVALLDFDAAINVLSKLPSEKERLKIIKIAQMTLSFETVEEISRIIAGDLKEKNLAGYFLRNSLNEKFSLKEQLMILKNEVGMNASNKVNFKYELLEEGIKLDISKTSVSYPGSLNKFKIIDLDISDTLIARTDIINWQVIKRLNVENCKLKLLMPAPELEWLNIANCDLRDLHKLKASTRLEYLDIRGVQNFPYDVLKKLKSLKTVIADKNQAGSFEGSFEIIVK